MTKYIMIPVSQIQSNTGQIKGVPKNPRFIKDERYKALLKSITDLPEMMELRPLLVFLYKGKYIVIGGNMRFKGVLELKWKEVPCMVIPANTSTRKLKEIAIKDNVAFGTDDWEALLKEWDTTELKEWGLDVPDFKPKTNSAVETYTLPDPTKTKTDFKLGDLIEIGTHRLYCGSSLIAADAEKLMGGGKAELLFTSPPYADQREYGGGKELDVKKIVGFIRAFHPFAKYQAINLGLKRKNHEIIEYWNEYIEVAKRIGYKFLSWNIWNRSEPKTMAQQQYFIPVAHEWIFVFGKSFKEINKTVECKQKGQRTKSINRQVDGSQIARSYEIGTHKKINSITTTAVATTGEHPAMFPTDLPKEYILAMTAERDVVIDCFGGSGTTMVVCEQLKRICRMMELDPRYCQIIVDRMLKLFPGIVVKLNGKPYKRTLK